MVKMKSILIVDDDPNVLFVLRTSLERVIRGVKTITAGGGREALEKFKHEPIDLLITDIRMPDITGVQLTEAIRENNDRTKIIWITAYGCHNIPSNVADLKVFRCLDKPIRIGEIRQAALEALNLLST